MNPARNAYEVVSTRKLVACKRCGESNLAWVKLASGSWALCNTSTRRPAYTGQNQCPEANPGTVFANKLAFHHCNESRMLNLYAELDTVKADCYLRLNTYVLDKHGKNASIWPASVAEEMQSSLISIEHVMRVARIEIPLWFRETL